MKLNIDHLKKHIILKQQITLTLQGGSPSPILWTDWKETLYAELPIKFENEFDCMSFRYSEEADDNWLDNCTNQITYYKCGENPERNQRELAQIT